MFHAGLMRHCCGLKDKFKFSKENQGDKLVITLTGDKKDVETLDKKIDAAHVLMGDCCTDKDGKNCC